MLGLLPPTSLLPRLPTFTVPGDVPAVGGAGGGSALPSTSASGSAAMVISAGSYMGEGPLPIPEKLVKKIIKLEFIEMHELLPEFWLCDKEESKTLLGLPRRKKATITNIFQWLQCFSATMGMLARAYPQMVPDLMAYQATIIRCYQDFEELHWAQYNRMYRRQVSITKDLQWGKVDATLYSKCFAGKARRRTMWSYCLTDNHATNECPDHPSNMAWPWSVPQSRPQEQTTFSSWRQPDVQPLRSKQGYGTCDLSRCTYNPYKFLHICSVYTSATEHWHIVMLTELNTTNTHRPHNVQPIENQPPRTNLFHAPAHGAINADRNIPTPHIHSRPPPLPY